MQPKAFQPRSDSIQSAVNGFVHPSILPFGNKVCASGFSVSTMKDEPGNPSAAGAHDLPARVSPAALRHLAATRSPVTAEDHRERGGRPATSGAPERLRWVETDLSVWRPRAPFDFVVRATRRR